MPFIQGALTFKFEAHRNIVIKSGGFDGIVYIFNSECSVGHLYAVGKFLSCDGANEPLEKKVILCYHVPGKIVDIFRCFDRDLALTTKGNIFRLPKWEQNTQAKENIPISESALVRQISGCKSVCSLRESTFAVLASEPNNKWTVNVFEVKRSSSNCLLLKVFTTTWIAKTDNKSLDSSPMIVAFKCGGRNDDNNNHLHSNVVKQLLKNPSELKANSWLLIIGIGSEGNVYSTLFNDNTKTNPVNYLFSFKQPIKSIFKHGFNGNSSPQVTAVSFIGVLGKQVMFTSLENNKLTKSRHEFYVAGPIATFNGTESSWKSFYTTESAIWLSQYVLKSNEENVIHPTLNLVPNYTEDIVAVGTAGTCVLLFTSCGHLLLFHESDFENGLNYGEKPAANRPEMLGVILQSSLKLAEVNRKYMEQRKKLEELTCLSHLKLNKSLRKTFSCSVSTAWLRESPSQVTIHVQMTNKGDFSVVGSHWVFVANATSSTNAQTHCIPLPNGLEVGKSVEATLKFEFRCIISCQNDFPISVRCGLHFNAYSIALSIDLAEWRLNEFYYLDLQTQFEPPKTKSDTSTVLWEMADRRLETGFHQLNRFKPSHKLSFKLAPLKSLLVIKNSKLLNVVQLTSQDDLLKKTMIYLVKNSKSIDLSSAACGQISASLFGINLTISMEQSSDSVTISVSTSSPNLLIKLKKAIINRFKLTEALVENEETSSKCLRLSSSLNEKCQEFKGLIEGSVCDNERRKTELLKCLYDQLRQTVSIQLPFT